MVLASLERDVSVSRCRRRTKPVTKPKLGALLPVIDAILEADRTGPVKWPLTQKITTQFQSHRSPQFCSEWRAELPAFRIKLRALSSVLFRFYSDS